MAASFTGRRPGAWPATRRCTWSRSSPLTTASTTRPASGATIARASSSLQITAPLKECFTASFTLISCSKGLEAWTRAFKELQRLLSQKNKLRIRYAACQISCCTGESSFVD